MNSPITPPSSVSIQQSKATNPEKTVWVSANAGSGKTYVLSRRVIRLLLKGAKPSELLCLTFTKAAAAEMSNRVFEVLGQWTMMEDGELKEQISQLTGEVCQNHQMERARKLFAIALDTPGGLRIQTIHAFCESLLHQFPLEANVPGHFEMMDDLSQSLLLDTAKRNVILAGLGMVSADLAATSKAISSAFETIRQYASDQAIDSAILALIHQRDDFMEWIRLGGGDAVSAFASMWAHFAIDPHSTQAQLFEKIASNSILDESDFHELVELCNKKEAPAYKKVIKKIHLIQNSDDQEDKFTQKCNLFLSSDQSKGVIPGHHTLLNKEEHLKGRVQQEHSLLLENLELVKTFENLKASQSLFVIVEAVLIEYGNLKKRNGLLDFTDLISRAANLLNRSNIADWVQFKLDQGISHVLVDEAQDTSPLQWQIIEAIISEFYAGKGAKQGTRTTFIVGDEKQSIYSFQGADPNEFGKQQKNLEKKTQRINQQLEKVPLTVSFRSTNEVLSAVDQVFSLPQNRKGLGLRDEQPTHSATRRSDRGEVFLWPLVLREPKITKVDWRRPPDEIDKVDAEVKLAKKIAITIKSWIDSGQNLPGKETPIRAGDVLILVRKRDRFVTAMNRELKREGLPSAGADRLKLTDHIAIEDMIALGRFATTAMDDVALAGLLKSPVFGMCEDDLFTLAHDRGSQTLLESLRSAAREQQDAQNANKWAKAVTLVDLISANSGRLPVYEFYARLFAKANLRHKYRAQFGNEVEEVLDGFFQLTLDYDNRSGLGLLGFIEWLDSSSPELKREIDMKADEVRVITAHSSKGLEAPIVFLVDPGGKPYDTRHAPGIIKLANDEGEAGYLWQAKKANRLKATQPVYDEIEAFAEEEYRRLLYVGMTRAADRLIICGYRKEKEPDYDHWYSMVENGLEAHAIDPEFKGQLVELEQDDPAGKIRQWVITNKEHQPKELKTSTPIKTPSTTELPNWISKVKSEPAPPRPLSPSGIVNMFDIEPSPKLMRGIGNENALLRGNAVHHLLQILPDIEPQKHKAVMEKYFATSEAIFLEAEQLEIEKQVNGILNSPDLQALFAGGSRSEVELSGKVKIRGQEYLVRGVIDRLVVTDQTLSIIDYKTNKSVPKSVDDTPSEYLLQMALYHQLIKPLYPDRKIEAALVWTQNASIMAISAEMLDNEMDKLNKSLPLPS